MDGTEMDGTDRRIYKKWTAKLTTDRGFAVSEEAYLKRDRVEITLTNGTSIVDIEGLSTMIRMLTEAKERAEAFATMDGLEKVVP